MEAQKVMPSQLKTRQDERITVKSCTPFHKMQTQTAKLQQKQASSDSESLCQSDELVIVREHMNFIIGLLLVPDFKRTVNWSSLKSSDLSIDE